MIVQKGEGMISKEVKVLEIYEIKNIWEEVGDEFTKNGQGKFHKLEKNLENEKNSKISKTR